MTLSWDMGDLNERLDQAKLHPMIPMPWSAMHLPETHRAQVSRRAFMDRCLQGDITALHELREWGYQRGTCTYLGVVLIRDGKIVTGER